MQFWVKPTYCPQKLLCFEKFLCDSLNAVSIAAHQTPPYLFPRHSSFRALEGLNECAVICYAGNGCHLDQRFYLNTTELLGICGLVPLLEVLSPFTGLILLGGTAAYYVIDFSSKKLADLVSILDSVCSLILMLAYEACIGALPESRIQRRSLIRGWSSISCLVLND